MSNSVSFFLNGEEVTIQNPSPDLMLIDYLRSEEVGLTGAKKGCGEGGCGACTVILSHWDEAAKAPAHHSINSCLRPVCALSGLSVTTVEGTGAVVRPAPAHQAAVPSGSRYGAPLNAEPSPEFLEAVAAARNEKKVHQQAAGCADDGGDHVHGGMNPVAHRLAANNGTQCGYCSVGFVMNMSAFITNNPNATKKEIEDAFDGNICRCTGYRAILTGMKTFASDWSTEDELERMKCLTEDGCDDQCPSGTVSIPFPPEARFPGEIVESEDAKQEWYTASNLADVTLILNTHDDKVVRLVHANTSYGVYQEEYEESQVLVDIRSLKELKGIDLRKDKAIIGASTTYTEFLDVVGAIVQERHLPENSRLGALNHMGKRTAGMIVRNAASLAGNSMMAMKHIHEGEPFPSDLFTVLYALEASVDIYVISSKKKEQYSIPELVERIRKEEGFSKNFVLLRYHIHVGGDDIVLAQKTAIRQVNSHSIVNATTVFDIKKSGRLDEARLIFGGIAPYPWEAKKTGRYLKGKELSEVKFATLAKKLRDEVLAELKVHAKRMAQYPSEGFTAEYKAELAVGFLYRAIINALNDTDPRAVPYNLKSAGEIPWGHWPVSGGLQSYENQDWKAPMSQPYVKLAAFYQTSGQVDYTHEIKLPATGLNGAFAQSKRALANFHYVIPGKKGEASIAQLQGHLKEKFEDFRYLVTWQDIPKGGVNLQGIGADQPLFATDKVQYVGQVLCMVLAPEERQAFVISNYVADHCVAYTKVQWPAGPNGAWSEEWSEPIISLDKAIEMGSVYPDNPKTASWYTHIWKITRPESSFEWADLTKDPLDKRITVNDHIQVDGVNCMLIGSTQSVGSQIHFYMETQSAVALPSYGEQLKIHPSSQSPMEMHNVTATALGVEFNQVEVEVHQLGGGYGGKTEQAKFIAGPAAVAAKATNKPIRLVMQRANDTAMIGKRHPYYGQYQIAIDKGDHNPADKGLIRGFRTKFWGDGGAFYDCSYIVSNCVQLRTDSAYYVKNFETVLDVCRTNTAPNTAFRSFGDIQGSIIQENAIDDAAFMIGMDAEEVRAKNMYVRGQTTPFGQALSYCYMRDVWKYTKEVSNFEEKKRELATFNSANKWRKRGVYMVPVKYGSGYNLVALEQAAAVISVYQSDGTISINQGGVDMGQGFMTKCEQVASYVLNVPMDMIRIHHAKTAIIPNPTSTGGSTGTAYNGEAIKQACEELRSILMDFAYKMKDEMGPEYCAGQHIDFWNYEDGWAHEFTDAFGQKKIIWQNLVQLAYNNRVSLVVSFNAKIPGGTTPVPAMGFKQSCEQPNIPGVPFVDERDVSGIVDSFVGFTFSASCSVVEVDILTGEHKIISSDVVYDMGWSLNPAIDIGQVEGAFIQGVGYVTTENLVHQPDGEEKGRLNTLNTWRYKPPAVSTIPLELNTHLFPRSRAEHVPENPNGLFSSKEVGEPPLVLAGSVFFAIKAAVRASRLERGLDGLFNMKAPATVQEIRKACAVSLEEMEI